MKFQGRENVRMIIYKVIKYKILEICLETILRGIYKNCSPKRNIVRLVDLELDTQIKQVEFGGRMYYNCIVEEPVFEHLGTKGILGYLSLGKDAPCTYFCKSYEGDDISKSPIINVIEW